jgi:hypothetical protein
MWCFWVSLSLLLWISRYLYHHLHPLIPAWKQIIEYSEASELHQRSRIDTCMHTYKEVTEKRMRGSDDKLKEIKGQHRRESIER